jgi:hypothetical protein
MMICQGLESQESIEILFKFASIKSDTAQEALRAHFVFGLNAKDSADSAGMTKGNFSKMKDKLVDAAKEVNILFELNYKRTIPVNK